MYQERIHLVYVYIIIVYWKLQKNTPQCLRPHVHIAPQPTIAKSGQNAELRKRHVPVMLVTIVDGEVNGASNPNPSVKSKTRDGALCNDTP